MPAPFYTANNDFFGQSRNTVGSWASGGGSNSGWNNPWQFQDSNLRYQPYFENSPGGGPGDSGSNYQNPLGWTVYDPSKQNVGDSYDIYDTSGNFLKTDQFKDEPGMLEGMFSDPLFWSFLAAAGGMSAFLPGGWANAGAGTTGGLSEVIGGLESTTAPTLSQTLTGTALEDALAAASTEAMSAYGGSAAHAASQVAGIMEMGGAMTMYDLSAFAAGAGITTAELLTALKPMVSPAVFSNLTDTLTNPGGNGGTTTPGGTTGNTTVPTGNGGNGGGGGGGLDLANLIKLLGGAYDMSNADRNTDAIVGWLNSQQNYIDGLYAPGSAEYNALWDQMSRTDAAAGRNSQYGPRSVDLAAKLAGIKGDLRTKLATGVADVYSNAINKEGNGAGLGAALSQLFGGQTSTGSSSLVSLLNSLFKGGTINLDTLFSGS